MSGYSRLISGERPHATSIPERSIEEQADSDRGRVLYMAPVRRLQDKAQVFSLERDAAIRSRLSHSLEVSSVGRYIAQQIIKKIGEKGDLEKYNIIEQKYHNTSENKNLPITIDRTRAFITFVETACLLHDVGNPPFGHFGERAIGNWFYENREDLLRSGVLSEINASSNSEFVQNYKDFSLFDGNAQGYRIIHKLQRDAIDVERGSLGLNLTHTSAASMVKYPVPTHAAESVGYKKGGISCRNMRNIE